MTLALRHPFTYGNPDAWVNRLRRRRAARFRALLDARAVLIRWFPIHHFPRRPTHRDCLASVDSTILLTAAGLLPLFPEAWLARERLLGIVKSYTAVHGWPAPGDGAR